MDYPRVTEVLRPFTTYDQVPKNILERAAAKGTSVHALCAGIAKDEWIPDGMIDEELIGYVNSFKKWRAAQVSKFLVIEKRYQSATHEYSGQVDFVVEGTDGKIYLVDIKTSSAPQKTYPVQMAAYDYLLKTHGMTLHAAMLVYLDKDGEFPDIHLLEDLQTELDVFMKALSCWKFFNKRRKNVRKDNTTRADESTEYTA